MDSAGEDNVFLRLRVQVRESVKISKGSLRSSRFDTSDVIQEAMLQIWRDLEKSKLRELVYPRSLIGKISRGHTAKMRRFHSAEKRSVRKEAREADENSIADRNQDRDRLEHDEELKRLLESIKKLEAVDKYIVYRRFFENATFVSMGSDLGRSESWARRRYLSLIKSLKRSVDGAED